MRLFTAITLPESTREIMIQKMSDFGKTVHWTPPSQLHLTLQFLDEQPETLLPDLINHLASVKHPPFELALKGNGVFPLQGQPKIFWTSFDDTTLDYVSLCTLKNTMDAALRPLHLRLDKRRYIPHITVARLTPQFQYKMLQFLKEAFNLLKGTSFPVDAFQLYRSDLSNNGAVHSIIETFPLMN